MRAQQLLKQECFGKTMKNKKELPKGWQPKPDLLALTVLVELAFTEVVSTTLIGCSAHTAVNFFAFSVKDSVYSLASFSSCFIISDSKSALTAGTLLPQSTYPSAPIVIQIDVDSISQFH